MCRKGNALRAREALVNVFFVIGLKLDIDLDNDLEIIIAEH